MPQSGLFHTACLGIEQIGTGYLLAQGNGGGGHVAVDIPKEVYMTPIYFLMYIVERMSATFKQDICPIPSFVQGLRESFPRESGKEDGLPASFSRVEHTAYDALNLLVGGITVSSERRCLCGENDQCSLFPGFLYLPQIADGNDLHTGQDDGMEMFCIDRIVHGEHPLGDLTSVIEHLGMDVSEVTSYLVGKQSGHLVVIHIFHLHSTLVIALRPIQIGTSHECLYRIEHSYVGYVLSGSAEHVFHACQKDVEILETSVICWISP